MIRDFSADSVFPFAPQSNVGLESRPSSLCSPGQVLADVLVGVIRKAGQPFGGLKFHTGLTPINIRRSW